MKLSSYQFTNNWFKGSAEEVWDKFLPKLEPEKILEIGSFEGASTCYMIEKLSRRKEIELHCIDTWEGGIEHQAGGGDETDMNAVESRFKHNTSLAVSRASKKVTLICHKGYSNIGLVKLLAEGKQNYFDFIYVDGSHQAPDVLSDAVLSFQLLKIGGVMVFDDYLWAEDMPYGRDLIRCPKFAIDAFTNIYFRKVHIMAKPLYQLFVKKVSD